MKNLLIRNSLLICMLFFFSSCSTANKTGDLVFKNFSKQGKTHLFNDEKAPKATFEFNVEYLLRVILNLWSGFKAKSLFLILANPLQA